MTNVRTIRACLYVVVQRLRNKKDTVYPAVLEQRVFFLFDDDEYLKYRLKNNFELKKLLRKNSSFEHIDNNIFNKLENACYSNGKCK